MDQEKKVPGSLAGSFVVGGAIGAIVQVLMIALAGVLPVPDLVPPVTLVILGLVGMVLVLCGAYAKITEVGGFGANIMFCGLVDAVAGIFMGATMESGGNRGEGVKGAIKFALSVLGSLSLVGAVLGFVLGNSGNAGVLASLGDQTVSPGPITILYAFLMGGVISIVGQALVQFTPLPLPVVILLEGACGYAMAIMGVFTMLEVFCGGGLVATVVDAGGGMLLGGAVLAVAHTPMRIIITGAVMVIVVIIGIITGNILVSRAQKAR